MPSRSALPFGDNQEVFEAFLMSWNFLVSYGYDCVYLLTTCLTGNSSYPLHLSTFTLDEFERALRHHVADPPCLLLAEIHSVLIYNMRTVPFNRHSAVISLNRERPERGYHWKARHGVTLSELTEVLGDVGNNWERVALRHQEGREGWQDALVGCIKDVSKVKCQLHRSLT
jgi:bromodomain adjacent to zinc finger domain protein 1A